MYPTLYVFVGVAFTYRQAQTRLEIPLPLYDQLPPLHLPITTKNERRIDAPQSIDCNSRPMPLE